MNAGTAATLPERRIDLDLVIETPENVVLTYQLAGPSVRFLAFLLDWAIRVLLLILVSIFVLMPLAALSAGISFGMFFITLFAIDWLYFGLCEWWFRGKTLGKHAFGLRVIQEAGYPINFWASFLRNLLRAADNLSLYGFGLATMFVTGKFRRLGDLVAGTVVIEERRVSVPREPIILEKIEPLPRTELGGWTPSGQTLALIEEYLGRRHVLTYRRGHALAVVLARVLARKLAYSGDERLFEQYPMAFLARVYATFYRVREGDEEVEPEFARPRATANRRPLAVGARS